MSEAQTPSSTGTPVSTPTSNRNNNRRNKKKKNQHNDQGPKFQGATPDFGAVFVLGDETSEGRPSSFKKAVVAAEVYVAATYPSSAKVLCSLFDDESSLPTLAPPPEPVGEDADNELRRVMYMERYNRHLTKSEQLTNTLHSLFTIIWGQCSPGIQSRIRSSIQYLIKKEEGDCAWLLEEIRKVMFNFTNGRYRLKTLLEGKMEILRFQQGRLPTFEYFEKYLEKVHGYERGGGSFGQEKSILAFVDEYDVAVINAKPGRKPVPPALPPFRSFGDGQESMSRDEVGNLLDPYEKYVDNMRKHLASLKRWEKKERKYLEMRAQVARDIYLGYMIIHNASDHHFGELKYGLHQDFLTGSNNFPDNAEDALRLLSNFTPKKSKNHSHSRRNNNVSVDNEVSTTTTSNVTTEPAVSLYQTDAIVKGKDGKSYSKVECWKCGAFGHYRDQCPTNVQLAQTVVSSASDDGDNGNYELNYYQADDRQLIPSSNVTPAYHRILLDSGSTINTFKDRELVNDLHTVNDGLVVLTNGGTTPYTEKGTFGAMKNVWFHSNGLENIISLALLQEVAKVSYDSSADAAFVATFTSGHVWRFKQTVNGLFIYEHVNKNNTTNENVLDYCLISTVGDNEKQFHRREVEAAQKAGKLYRLLGRPSRRTFQNAISNGLIQNCPVTIEDVHRYFDIYGSDVATLQGKTKNVQVRDQWHHYRAHYHHQSFDIIGISPYVSTSSTSKEYRFSTLYHLSYISALPPNSSIVRSEVYWNSSNKFVEFMKPVVSALTSSEVTVSLSA